MKSARERTPTVLFFILLALACVNCATRAPEPTGTTRTPRVFQLDPARLVGARHCSREANSPLAPAMLNLLEDAENALKAGPFSVVYKDATPGSGDKHDYMSVSPYWWPNPNTADGLPYVQRDGETNPERDNYDNAAMGNMSAAVQTLALAYFFTGDERYADRAALLLRVWFLDDATRMNPNLNFSQAIPGVVNTGRSTGIIDALCLPPLVDAVGLLEGSTAWHEDYQSELEAWFGRYLDWLLTSRHGQAESKARNNHGTCYDVQVVAYARFVGNDRLARQVLRDVAEKRIAMQIEPDGRQPRELARTRSFSYTAKNLQALCELADMGRLVGVDLWHFETRDGRSIRKALEWAVANGFERKEWPNEQLGDFGKRRMLPVFRRAAIAYREPRYERLIDATATDWVGDRVNLLLFDSIIEEARSNTR